MVSERRNMPEQERSIKDRGNALFVEPGAQDADRTPAKPFAVYLRETPADPMSPGVKALLWVIGVVVFLLFAASLWRIQHRSRLKPKSEAPAVGAAWPLPKPGYRGVIVATSAAGRSSLLPHRTG